MRVRDLIFGALAVVLLVGYIVVGQRVAPLLLPSAAATPTPARPTGNISAPTIGGTIAFVLRGDVFMLTGGQYASRTEDGRAQTPALSPDGQTVYFVRVEQIDGKSTVDGAVVNARLGYSDIIAKPASGGTEDVLLGIRPEHVAVLSEPVGASLPAEVYVSEALGNETLVRLQVGGQELVARADASYEPPIGGRVWISPDLRHAHLFDARTEQRIS